ncbi:MAG TPA: hypothetical protein VMU94_03595, partial [Streptosporangiaceae bacterium]|nr:hypothetical protein [Streptosporangiaceae bacterium]
MDQRIASARLRDGTQIAYATAGPGPFLVYAPGGVAGDGACHACAVLRDRHQSRALAASRRRSWPRSAWAAVIIDAVLLLVCAGQHSVMARSGFKRRLARLLPAAAERSTYVLAASLALILLFSQWQPLPALVWRVSTQPWVAPIWSGYAIGWLVVVATTFMVDHLDFLGLKQQAGAGVTGRTGRRSCDSGWSWRSCWSGRLSVMKSAKTC